MSAKVLGETNNNIEGGAHAGVRLTTTTTRTITMMTIMTPTTNTDTPTATKLPNSQALKFSKSQFLKISNSQTLKLSRSQTLTFSNSQTLELSKSQTFKVQLCGVEKQSSSHTRYLHATLGTHRANPTPEPSAMASDHQRERNATRFRMFPEATA